MRRTTEEVQALKEEIQAWLEADDELLHDTLWREVEDHFWGGKKAMHAGGNRIYTEISLPGGPGGECEVYLALCPGSGLSSALDGHNLAWDRRQYLEELEAIIDKHDFWYTLNDDAILILGFE